MDWKKNYKMKNLRRSEKTKNGDFTVKESAANNPVLEIFKLSLYSLFMIIVIEYISRGDFGKIMEFIYLKPVEFVVNYLLILLVFSISLFTFKKRLIIFIISSIVLVISITSRIVNVNRGMPLAPYDLLSFDEALEVSGSYLNKTTIILLLLFLTSIVLAIIVIWKKDRTRANISISKIIFALMVAILLKVELPTLSDAGFINISAANLGKSYLDNGFIYSFYDGIKKIPRSKPDKYGEEELKKLRSDLDKKESADNKQAIKNKPNIVIVQLEAFMDPTQIPGCTFSEDPMPNMRKLMKSYTSGYMNVPTVGGGTARTEYEVLSSFNFDYLNQGEIPYKTFISKGPSYSIARELSRQGYKTSAVHNYDKAFYSRDKGYENLGFDRFISLEAMVNNELNPSGWPKDAILTRYIMDQINKDRKPDDFIFAVSVQGHGKYPDKIMDMDYKIKLKNSKISEKEKNQIEYYVNQVKEMDNMVGALVKKVNESNEPTVLVFYGDHKPGLRSLIENQKNDSLYDSIFVITNNFTDKKTQIPKDFQSYQLSSLVEKVAGLKYGPVNALHAYSSQDKNYQEKLKLLQYDILFGDKYSLNKNEFPLEKKMKIGDGKLRLDDIKNVNKSYIVSGDGFNQNTQIIVNGKEVKAIVIDENNLKVDDEISKGKNQIYLQQVDNKGQVMYKTGVKNVNFR